LTRRKEARRFTVRVYSNSESGMSLFYVSTYILTIILKLLLYGIQSWGD
jgi:hypothetical protein